MKAMHVQGKIRPYISLVFAIACVVDAGWIALALFLSNTVNQQPWSQLHTLAWIVAAVAFTLTGEVFKIYRSFREESLFARTSRVWFVWILVVSSLLFAAFISKYSEQYSRASTLLWFLLAPSFISSWHIFAGVILRVLRARGHNSRRAAIVGVCEIGENIAKNIKSKPWIGIEIVGFFDDRHRDRLSSIDDNLGQIKGNYDDLLEKAHNGEIDIVYIALPLRAESRIVNLINLLGDTTASVYLTYNFGGFNLLPQKSAPRWSRIGSISILGIVETPFQGLLGALKRVEDLALGVCILALISVPMLIIAAAVKLTSKGPIFFKQTRYGLNGKKIKILKFRSMTVCEDGDKIAQATKNDSRITPLGAFLRKSSMDELPQFLHVITGSMSIVGPRPHAVAHNEYYRSKIDWYMVRHKVKPGITGWAQVNGWRGETDTPEKMMKRVEHDIVYIRNWSLLFDLKIIFKTVFGAKAHSNAY
ncbi:MAG: undecaprenyl-phosphate glucose phosphotransferase [Proteobacteria bacterium]|nr:undecaprenyl-phosphate glucose phosphotransferase [Pseudomonadota bacterium]